MDERVVSVAVQRLAEAKLLIGIAAGSIVGIYAVYLVATYLLSKSIVRNAIVQRRTA